MQPNKQKFNEFMTQVFHSEKFRFDSNFQYESFIKSVSRYGLEGHEHLEITHQNGKVSLKTIKKSCWLLRIIEKLFYKSAKRQVSNVAKVALLILECNQEFFSNNQTIINQLTPFLNKAESKLGIERLSLIKSISHKTLSSSKSTDSLSAKNLSVKTSNDHEIKHLDKIKIQDDEQVNSCHKVNLNNQMLIPMPDTAILCADNKIVECRSELLKDCLFFNPSSIKNITTTPILKSYAAEHQHIKSTYDLESFSQKTIDLFLSVLNFCRSFELNSLQKGIAGYALENIELDELNELYALADYVVNPHITQICAEAFGHLLNEEAVLNFLERELLPREEVFDLPIEFKLKVLQFLADNLDSLIPKISQLYDNKRLSNQDLFVMFSSDNIKNSEATIFDYLLHIVKDPDLLLIGESGERLIDCIRLDRLSSIGFEKIKNYLSVEERQDWENKFEGLSSVEKLTPSRLGRLHVKKLSPTKHQILWTIDQTVLRNNTHLKSPSFNLPANLAGGIKEFEIALSPFISNESEVTQITLMDCLKEPATQGCNFTYKIKLNDYRMYDNSRSRFSGVFLPLNLDPQGFEVTRNFLHKEELKHIENNLTKEILIEYTIELIKLKLDKRNTHA